MINIWQILGLLCGVIFFHGLFSMWNSFGNEFMVIIYSGECIVSAMFVLFFYMLSKYS